MIFYDLPTSNALGNPIALKVPQIRGVSYRTGWQTLQPNAPVGGPTNNPNDASWNWSYFDQATAQAAQYNVSLSLRVFFQNQNTPAWAQAIIPQFAAIAPPNINVWWDPNYQAYVIAAIQAIGTRYASSNIGFVSFNIATSNSGDWSVPHVTNANWTNTSSFVIPAVGSTVNVQTGGTNSGMVQNQYCFIPSYGWFFASVTAGSLHTTLQNPGIAGNAAPGTTVPASTTIQVNDVANLQGPAYRYTTARFVAAVEAIISASHTAFPNSIVDQEVGRSGTLDPYPASSPPAASAPVQESIGTAAGTNPYTKAYTSNVTAGNTLVAAVTLNSNTATISSVTDSLNGAQWTLVTFVQGQSRCLAIYQFSNTLGGACTLSVTWSTTGTAQIALFELSGNTVAVDVSATSNNTAATTVTTPSITPTFSNELVLAFCLGGTGQSGQAGWTFQGGTSLGSQYILPGSSAPITATFTQASAAYLTTIIAFQGAASTGGTTFQYNSATQIMQWAYANIPTGKVSMGKNTLQPNNPVPSVALSQTDGADLYLPAQSIAGSTNTSGTTGTIPANSLLQGQFLWACYDVTGLYSATSTASGLKNFGATGGKPYQNPIPIWQLTVKICQAYKMAIVETYEADAIFVLPVAGSFSGDTNALSQQANFSSQQALTACRSR